MTLFEGKGCIGRHHEEARGDELRGQDNMVWNTDLIETVGLKNPISQTAQRDDVQRMKHMLP